VKRGSHNVTVSWSRFENAQTGILFGLTADIVKEPDQKLTVHHSYFAGLTGKESVRMAENSTLTTTSLPM
jgi:Pectate lyase.